ncbi:Hypothetical predicted protein [Olea europaea subsp. europaea]|nr:Hypothetical predicted protein [Olea europaea subsp. europaea]
MQTTITEARQAKHVNKLAGIQAAYWAREMISTLRRISSLKAETPAGREIGSSGDWRSASLDVTSGGDGHEWVFWV